MNLTQILGQLKSERARTARFGLTTLACLLLSSSVFAMTINSATAVGPQLTITGTGFSGTPLSVMFNGSPITVVSSTPTQIVATINPLPPAGTYRVIVKAGTLSSGAVYVTLSNVVAKVSLLNQAASIPLTTLWTPALDGVYRVSIYIVQVPPFPPAGNPTGELDLWLKWTDDAGTQSQIQSDPLQNQYSVISLGFNDEGTCGTYPRTCAEMIANSGVQQGLPGAVSILQVKGGTPIQYTAQGPTLTPPAYYDLFITVEQI